MMREKKIKVDRSGGSMQASQVMRDCLLQMPSCSINLASSLYCTCAGRGRCRGLGAGLAFSPRCSASLHTQR